MKVEFKYAGQSGIVSDLATTRVGFATNVLREPSYFNGELARPLVCREGLAALHSVVVSDLKYRPKDRLEFRVWLEEQDRKFLASLPLKSEAIREELEAKELRLQELRDLRKERRAPFVAARRKYFDYAYENQWELDALLDPVITVHPDELSFEAFSKDESSYGRFAIKYDLFGSIDAFECGTTNIDFSATLAGHMNRMRSYRSTRFDVDAKGFTVLSGESTHKEKKIELPPSWVKGFLEVQSVMSMGLTRLRLQPIDLFSILRFLRRHKARTSPRALRFELRPGERAKVVFEPWEHTIDLTAVYEGAKPQTIRTWGRRRLFVLERLLPMAERIDLFLAGHGLPSLYVVDLGDATFTLGLSGWTDNDWTGDATSRMSLLNRKLDVNGDQLAAVYDALRTPRYASAASLVQSTGLSSEAVQSALSFLCQAGRAMVDLGSAGIYRHRDLFNTPFDPAKEAARLAQAAEDADPKAKLAREIVAAGGARIIARRPVFEAGVGPADASAGPGYKISGNVSGAGGRVRPMLHVDPTGSIVTAKCTCPDYAKFKLTKGPCEHVLALRLAHMQRLEAEGRKM